MIIDEYCYVADETMYETILPQASVGNRVVFVISSPEFREHPRMENVLARESVWPYMPCFAVIIRPVICHACSDKPVAEQMQCPHRLSLYPPFRPMERVMWLADIMPPEQFRQEIAGVSIKTETLLVPRVRLAHLYTGVDEDASTLRIPQHVIGDTIIFGIDPCGGEGQCTFAITAMIYNMQGVCIVSIYAAIHCCASECSVIALLIVGRMLCMKARPSKYL